MAHAENSITINHPVTDVYNFLLDGANNCFFGLIRGIPVEDVHMGQRVKAKWADELKPDHTSIQWFEPSGEPDADYEMYKDYL